MECALSLPKITSECSDDAIRKELVWRQYRARRGLPPAHDRSRVFAEVSLQRTAAAGVQAMRPSHAPEDATQRLAAERGADIATVPAQFRHACPTFGPARRQAPWRRSNSGVKKLRPPLRQVVVFVHHGVPNGDFEAIRRLLERALAAEPSASRGRGKGAAKAAEMASREIDKLDDRTATNEERASRKRKLILGPREFRGMRRKRVPLQELARGARPAHCSQHRQVTRVVDCPRNLIQPRPVVLGKRTGNDAPIPSPKFPVRAAHGAFSCRRSPTRRLMAQWPSVERRRAMTDYDNTKKLSGIPPWPVHPHTRKR